MEGRSPHLIEEFRAQIRALTQARDDNAARVAYWQDRAFNSEEKLLGGQSALFQEISKALHAAREKHPSSAYRYEALVAEVGEVGEAIIKQDPENLEEELVQVIVTAIRMLTEKDPARPWTDPSPFYR